MKAVHSPAAILVLRWKPQLGPCDWPVAHLTKLVRTALDRLWGQIADVLDLAVPGTLSAVGSNTFLLRSPGGVQLSHFFSLRPYYFVFLLSL
jgi:hypothetical protein